jgi:SlyX protein
MSSEARLSELELKFTEQAHLIDELSQVVYAQGKAIDVLTAELRRLNQKVVSEPGLVDASRDDKPPHY